MANSKLKCRYCKQYFPREQIRSHPNHFCSNDHFIEYQVKKGMEVVEKQRRAKEREFKRDRKEKIRKAKQEHNERKQAILPLGTLCSKAQEDVNAMILAVDRYLRNYCIATGNEIEHAGHYHHAGTKYRISWLRFMHFNIHGQSHESNVHKSGDSANYRVGVVERYGQDYFDSLEEFKRLEDCKLIPAPTREEVIAMRKWCRAMTRIYKKMSLDGV